MNRIALRQQPSHHCVTGFVISRRLLFVFAHHHATAFGTHQDLILGALKVHHFHQLRITASGKKSSFVNEVSQVSTTHTGRTASNHCGIDVTPHRHLTDMNVQNLFTTAHIRQRHHNLTVKATRTQQSRVQDVRTVRCGNHDHVRAGFKTVHFHQHLVQRLFAFVVTAA